MIKKIWLYPPLAFARLGSASDPCENFQWAPSETTLKGNSRTRLAGATSLCVDDKGFIEPKQAGDSLALKDQGGFRPVCPFFELHASWSDDDGRAREGAVTPALLKRFGLDLRAVRWTVRLANRKAHHFTGAEGDIVSAEEQIEGGDTTKRVLKGSSRNGSNPLVPPDSAWIPFGWVQLTKPSGKFQGLRLRFTPPAGRVYAPTNLKGRLDRIAEYNNGLLAGFKAVADGLPPEASGLKQTLLGFADLLVGANKIWTALDFPPECRILNANAAWSTWAWPNTTNPLSIRTIAGLDAATLAKIPALAGIGDRSQLLRYLLPPNANTLNLPPGVFAYLASADRLLSGLGLLDDISDGLIEVRINRLKTNGGDLTARARIAVTPPQVAPDRRSPVSLADGLTDRLQRSEVREARWVSGRVAALSDAEAQDLLRRAFEAAGLQNADAVNDFFRIENEGLAKLNGLSQSPGAPWSPALARTIEPMPVTATARQHHRRALVRQVLEDFVRSHPDWIDKLVRAPVDPKPYYDRRMPGLMRGFDRHPLALTRRQRDFLESWSARLGRTWPKRTESTKTGMRLAKSRLKRTGPTKTGNRP